MKCFFYFLCGYLTNQCLTFKCKRKIVWKNTRTIAVICVVMTKQQYSCRLKHAEPKFAQNSFFFFFAVKFHWVTEINKIAFCAYLTFQTPHLYENGNTVVYDSLFLLWIIIHFFFFLAAWSLPRNSLRNKYLKK